MQRGVYEGFQPYLQMAYHIINGHRNCTEFVPNPEVNGLCGVTWDVAVVAVVIGVGTLFSLLMFTFSNMCCLLHAILLLYFADTVMNYVKDDRSPGGRLKIIKVTTIL